MSASKLTATQANGIGSRMSDTNWAATTQEKYFQQRLLNTTKQIQLSDNEAEMLLGFYIFTEEED